MGEFSLLYVSRSLLLAAEADAAIADIVRTSIIRNGDEEITGALFYTGTHFAQVLEGAEPLVRALMASIAGDRRHDLVDVVDTRIQPKRDFPSWSLAYVGRATYVQKHVDRLLRTLPASPVDALAVRSMRLLMVEQVAANT